MSAIFNHVSGVDCPFKHIEPSSSNNVHKPIEAFSVKGLSSKLSKETLG